MWHEKSPPHGDEDIQFNNGWWNNPAYNGNINIREQNHFQIAIIDLALLSFSEHCHSAPSLEIYNHNSFVSRRKTPELFHLYPLHISMYVRAYMCCSQQNFIINTYFEWFFV